MIIDNSKIKTDDKRKILKLYFQEPEVDGLKLKYKFIYATKFHFNIPNFLAYKSKKLYPEDLIRIFEEIEKLVLRILMVTSLNLI